MANVSNRITSTKQVWIVVHEDHYFKHLFYDMTIKCSYVGTAMIGGKITFHDQYQKEAHELTFDAKSKESNDLSLYYNVDVILGNAKRSKNISVFKHEDIHRAHIAQEIMLAANFIASNDTVDPEEESKTARLSEQGTESNDKFNLNEVLYIKYKESEFDNNLVVDNRDEEYKARQKTSFGSEAKAKEILGVDELQDPLVKARNRKPDDKTLLDIEDLTFTGSEDFVDENMPKCIRYPILEALRKTDMKHYGLEPVTKFQIGVPDIKACRGKAIDEFRSPEFIYNAIIELCDVVRPKDLVVYKWSNGLIVLQVGSWLVNAEYHAGVVVYGDDHKRYKLELLLTRYLSDKALRWDEYFSVEMDKDKDIFKPLSQYESEVGETIKLEIMTGTEYICKCGKPKDIKMCFAVDGYETIKDSDAVTEACDKTELTEDMKKEYKQAMKAYVRFSWFESSLKYDRVESVHESQLELHTALSTVANLSIFKDNMLLSQRIADILSSFDSCYKKWQDWRNNSGTTSIADKEYIVACKNIVDNRTYSEVKDEIMKTIQKISDKLPE